MSKPRVVLARVLHEDDELQTLEVYKSDDRTLTLNEGDRFVTILYTQPEPWAMDA